MRCGFNKDCPKVQYKPCIHILPSPNLHCRFVPPQSWPGASWKRTGGGGQFYPHPGFWRLLEEDNSILLKMMIAASSYIDASSVIVASSFIAVFSFISASSYIAVFSYITGLSYIATSSYTPSSPYIPPSSYMMKPRAPSTAMRAVLSLAELTSPGWEVG